MHHLSPDAQVQLPADPLNAVQKKQKEERKVKKAAASAGKAPSSVPDSSGLTCIN